MLFPLEDFSHFHGHNSSTLGQEYLISDSGEVSPVYSAASASHSTNSTNSSGSPPPPTLASSAGSNLEIELVWDSSLAKAPSGFAQAIIDAAEYYTTLFTSPTGAKEVINIDVGYGEIDGSTLASNALGESESYGYLTNYSTVTHALEKDGHTFSATNEPTSGQFFVTSADAKTLGLISGASTAVDGFIGFSTLSGTGQSWNMTANANGSNSGAGATQFDLQAVVQHEISEVMGRIGMEGEVINGKTTYTPLDLFNYKSAGVLELSGNGGYFSNNDGVTHQGTYNDSTRYSGDIADWASYSSVTQSGTLPKGAATNVSDSYDAFLAPGYNGLVSPDDILEDAALGYQLTATGIAEA